MTDTTLEVIQAPKVDTVVIHPTVLLSVTDHWARVAKDTKKRVIGTLMGYYDQETDSVMKLHVTNCYAVPFEEDKADPANIWFFDHIFHENMFNMMRRINGKEKIVGWYSTGPQIRKNDIDINEVLRRYNTQPAFVVIRVNEEDSINLPTEAYFTQEEIDADGNVNRQFIHVSSGIEASLEEEVGVEHLMRDIKDASQGHLSKMVSSKLNGLRTLAGKLKEMRLYLENVISGKYRYNHTIIQNFQVSALSFQLWQDIFNLLPNLQLDTMIQSFSVKSNDYMYVLYVSSLIKSIISLHSLINNRIGNKELEIENATKEKEAEAEKARIEAAKKEKEAEKALLDKDKKKDK